MKRFLITGALIAATATLSYAQDVNKLIDQKDVERVIRTLSADDMEGRATFSPGIDRAAKFIEGEFSKIGLKPLTGETGFRQNIPPMVKSAVTKSALSINGQTIAADKFSVSAGKSFNWTDLTGVEVLKGMTGVRAAFGRGGESAEGKKRLVLLDSTSAQIFARIADRNAGGAVAAKASADQTVFVIGNFADVKQIAASADVKTESVPLFNVAGMLPGKSKAAEFVVFSGHYDHLGIKHGAKTDSIYNGADDDASGTTAVIELAKYYKKLNNNERTLIFVAFTAEEIGGFGARHFTTTVNADKVVAMFNIEMIGKPSKWGENSAFITGFERSDFGQILQRNLEGTAFKFYPDPYPDQNLFYRSDNATLARLGVPAHTISTDQIDVDKDYHQLTDELKTLDVSNITAAIRAIALSSRTIVSGKDTPTRVAKLEK